jgi:hypothetical protein
VPVAVVASVVESLDKSGPQRGDGEKEEENEEGRRLKEN